MKVLVLVSTMTGTAEMVAEDIVASLPAGQAELVLAERASRDQVVGSDVLLIVSSTYGEGEVPEPAKRLFSEIKSGGGIECRFGVVGLGDRSLYAGTFAMGGHRWDEMLAETGGTRIAPIHTVDVATEADLSSSAVSWVNTVLHTKCWAAEGGGALPFDYEQCN